MKTIKVIDLLNKIANGEEVPKEIRYRDKRWEYTTTFLGTGYQYYDFGFQEWKTLQRQVYLEEHLNDEVEIIEEDEEIEKLEYCEIGDDTLDGLVKSINEVNKELVTAINGLVKEVKRIKG